MFLTLSSSLAPGLVLPLCFPQDVRFSTLKLSLPCLQFSHSSILTSLSAESNELPLLLSLLDLFHCF